MKTIHIITMEDLPDLKGQLVGEFDHNDTGKNPINDSTIAFYAEKRISLVAEIPAERGENPLYGFVRMFYNSRNTFRKQEDFVKKFNAEGEDRYYRLLTPDEVVQFNEYMIGQRK